MKNLTFLLKKIRFFNNMKNNSSSPVPSINQELKDADLEYELKKICATLDAVFGPNYAVNHPNLVVRLWQASICQNITDALQDLIQALETSTTATKNFKNKTEDFDAF